MKNDFQYLIFTNIFLSVTFGKIILLAKQGKIQNNFFCENCTLKVYEITKIKKLKILLIKLDSLFPYHDSQKFVIKIYKIITRGQKSSL